ncbi:heme-binding protein [Candidatus Gracilibacteria bacterium]|nr:heme-binding protein [Candidatus Gracilibacteria bacterium]
MNTLLIIAAVALVIWITGTLLAIRGIEEPAYTLVEQRDGYEIREYASYIVAEVEVDGDMRTALSAGFRQLAGYIFGGNTSKTSISMTAPVMDTMRASENIAMTAPVMDRVSNSGKHIVAFTMPSQYTLATLPKPDNANIRFRTVDKSRRAVLRYSWYATESRVSAMQELLRGYLIRDGYKTLGDMVSAQYNPPLSFPPLRRNEVMVDIE